MLRVWWGWREGSVCGEWCWEYKNHMYLRGTIKVYFLKKQTTFKYKLLRKLEHWQTGISRQTNKCHVWQSEVTLKSLVNSCLLAYSLSGQMKCFRNCFERLHMLIPTNRKKEARIGNNQGKITSCCDNCNSGFYVGYFACKLLHFWLCA